MKGIIVAVLFLFINGFASGQEDLIAQKNIFRLADSLNACGQINRFDTAIFKVADSLNNCHPLGYFQVAGELMNKSKLNEAAFLYYLGVLRYRYFNSVNPKYQASEDGALFGALKSVMGNSINIYQRVNIDNYISVLKKVTYYTSTKDYNYFSREKNIAKYNEVTKQWTDHILDLEANKEKYSTQWNLNRIEYEKSIDSIIEENKRKEETETKGK